MATTIYNKHQRIEPGTDYSKVNLGNIASMPEDSRWTMKIRNRTGVKIFVKHGPLNPAELDEFMLDDEENDITEHLSRDNVSSIYVKSVVPVSGTLVHVSLFREWDS